MKAVLLKPRPFTANVNSIQTQLVAQRLFLPELNLIISWRGNHLLCTTLRKSLTIPTDEVLREIEVDEHFVEKINEYVCAHNELLITLQNFEVETAMKKVFSFPEDWG